MHIHNRQSHTKRPARGRRLVQIGFTLFELIMVIILLGILAVYAAPRIFGTSGFYARGFHDETLALLRYAQKSAIAQRRTVCVNFTGSSAALTIALNQPLPGAPTPTCPVGSPVLTGPPDGSKQAAIPSVSHGITYVGVPTNFNFNGLGQPMDTSGVVNSAAMNIAISSAATITVEAVTGYVHD